MAADAVYTLYRIALIDSHESVPDAGSKPRAFSRGSAALGVAVVDVARVHSAASYCICPSVGLAAQACEETCGAHGSKDASHAKS